VSVLLFVIAAILYLGLALEIRETNRKRKIIDDHIEAFCKLLFLASDAKLDEGDEAQRAVYKFIRSLCDGTYREKL